MVEHNEQLDAVLKRIFQNLDEAKEFVKMANEQSDSFL